MKCCTFIIQGCHVIERKYPKIPKRKIHHLVMSLSERSQKTNKFPFLMTLTYNDKGSDPIFLLAADQEYCKIDVYLHLVLKKNVHCS